MVRCFIVDDEPPARQRLKRMLEASADIELVGEACDGVTALEQIPAARPDVVFLDIEMPELDGLGVAGALPSPRPAIVFVTAYDEHALRAFELSASDYLVKPVDRERLAQALDKVRHRRDASETDLARLIRELEPARSCMRMAVRSGAKYIVFDPSRVSAVIAQDHYSTILVDDRELLADDSLDELVRRLPARQFLRVHRSAIINLAVLDELVHEGDRRYVAVLSDAARTRVPISRERLPLVKSALGLV